MLFCAGSWDPSLASEQSVSQAVAEDLSPHSRAALKHLSHELAGAVVFDLGALSCFIDCSRRSELVPVSLLCGVVL